MRASQHVLPLRWVLFGIAGIAALLLASIGAQAACYSNGRQVSADAVNAFISSPSLVLQQNSNGGGRMISQLRDLSASNPATLQVILSLLPNANKDQKAAIGAALAQAARICVGPDQAYAALIQQAVAETGDQDLIIAYATVAGDRPIAAVAPAGVGLAGGATGQITTLGGPIFGFGAPAPGGVTTFTFRSFSFTGGTTGAGESPRRSVSP
jgi:hypothetical protein